jgi:hypothetical protein
MKEWEPEGSRHDERGVRVEFALLLGASIIVLVSLVLWGLP